MNKFDKALECLDEYKLEFTMPGICDDIRLLNSRQNKHIKKAIELGKLYKEYFDLVQVGGSTTEYEVLEQKIERLENE